MEIAIGKEGTSEGLSFQGPFPETCDCVKCNKQARLAFVAAENGGPYICSLYPNMKDEKFWLHDAASFAIYLCTDIKCHTATTLWNQA
jgi:hypothetical protein